MTPPVFHRVTTLDLKVQPWSWPFAETRRAEVSAHFGGRQREKPQLIVARVREYRADVIFGQLAHPGAIAIHDVG